MLTTIKGRKIVYLGHVLRGEKYRLLQLILKGKRGVSGRQTSWRKPGVHKAGELFRLAEDRDALFTVIANVRKAYEEEEYAY